MGFGFYGKLPSHGDFLSVNLHSDILQKLEIFLDKGLSFAKENSADWARSVANMPAWRFWLGPEVWGQGFAGVMVGSEDKVGRRFLKLIVYTPDNPQRMLPPPMMNDQTQWFDILETRLTAMQSGDKVDPVLEKLCAPQEVEIPPEQLGFWASGPDAATEMDELLPADYLCASANRSYWWTKGFHSEPQGVLCRNGAPLSEDFQWFINGFSEDIVHIEEEELRLN